MSKRDRVYFQKSVPKLPSLNRHSPIMRDANLWAASNANTPQQGKHVSTFTHTQSDVLTCVPLNPAA